MKKHIVLPVLILLFSQCCYKDECVFPKEGFEFNIKTSPGRNGFSRNDLNFFILIAIAKKTNAPQDTFFIAPNSLPSEDTSFKVLLFESEVGVTTGKTIKDFNYVLYNIQNSFSDTLRSLDYAMENETFTCGGCWYGSDSKRTRKVMHQRSLDYHGKHYTDGDFPLWIVAP